MYPYQYMPMMIQYNPQAPYSQQPSTNANQYELNYQYVLQPYFVNMDYMQSWPQTDRPLVYGLPVYPQSQLQQQQQQYLPMQQPRADQVQTAISRSQAIDMNNSLSTIKSFTIPSCQPSQSAEKETAFQGEMEAKKEQAKKGGFKQFKKSMDNSCLSGSSDENLKSVQIHSNFEELTESYTEVPTTKTQREIDIQEIYQQTVKSKNVVKNFLKLFQKYIRNPECVGELVTVLEVDHDEIKYLIKRFDQYIKRRNMNYLLMNDLIHHPQFKNIIRFFLQHRAKDQINYSQIQDKEQHLLILNNFYNNIISDEHFIDQFKDQNKSKKKIKRYKMN